MNEKEMIINLRRELYEYLNTTYKTCTTLGSEVKKNASLKSKYIAVLSNYHHMAKYYTKINSCNSFDEIKAVKDEISKEISSIRKEYNRLKNEYDELKSKNASKIEINRIVNEMNSIVNLNKMMNEFIRRIDLSLNIKNTKSTHINMTLPTISKPKKEEKQEEKVESKGYVSSYKDKDIKRFDEINHEICNMKERYFKMNQYDPEAVNLRKRIYDWCKKRETVVQTVCGYDGVNALINMESIEDDIYSKVRNNNKEYSVNSEEYMTRFDSLLDIISDLKMNGYNSKYYDGKSEDYVRLNTLIESNISSFKDMVMSVTDVSKNRNVDNMADEVISLLNVYNIDGDYLRFKDAHKGGMVGGEKISLEGYREGVNRIKSIVSSIKNHVKSIISRKNDNITIKSHSATLESDLSVLNDEREKLYDMFIQGRNKLREGVQKR